MTARVESIAASEAPDATGRMPRAPRPRLEFHPELDGVRGMMMAAVFLFHCAPKTGLALFDGFVGSMWISIDVFFALSGFLITRNLLDDEGNVFRYRNFYLNRALRIVPAYAVALLVVFVLLPHTDMAKALQWIPNPWWFVTYTFNVWITIHDGWPANHLMNHFWSLSVEEQFYLLWPPLVFLLPARRRPHLIVGVLLIAAAAEIYLLRHHFSHAVIHTNLLTRLDSLGVGAAVAFLHRSARREAVVPLLGRVFWVCLAVLVSSAVWSGVLSTAGWWGHVVVHPALMAWSAALVYLLIHGRGVFRGIARVFRLRAFVFLGKYSYGIYLFHWILQSAFDRYDVFGLRTRSPWANFVIVGAATIAAALLSWHAVEKQFLRLKWRTFRPRDPVAA
jgi:peptidoglycan/LPS O-acetylase OafA/YrhL